MIALEGQKHNDSETHFFNNDYRLKVKSVPDGWMDEYLEALDQITN